jgi:hypothetical protein
MLNIKTINNKDYIAYDEYVLDLTTGKWISINEFEELEKQLNTYEKNNFERLNEGVQTGQ